MVDSVQIMRENSQALPDNLNKTDSSLRSKTKGFLQKNEGSLFYLETSDPEVTRILLAQVLRDFQKITILKRDISLNEILFTDFNRFTTMTLPQNHDFVKNFPDLLVCICDNEEDLGYQTQILNLWKQHIKEQGQKIILIVRNLKHLKRIILDNEMVVNIVKLELVKLWKENEITLNQKAICEKRNKLQNVASTSARSSLDKCTKINLKEEESSRKRSSHGEATTTEADLKNLLQSPGVTELDAVVDEEGNNKLHLAAWEGKTEEVESLLLREAKNDVRNNYGETALHLAAHYGHRATVQMLLKYGFNVNATDNMYTWTPLHHACVFNNDDHLIEILLNSGAEMEIRDKYGQTALHWASQKGRSAVVNLLLKNGANINAQDHYYRDTPLHRATSTNQKEVVSILVQNGALLHYKNKRQQNALDIAKYNSFTGIIQILESQKK